MTGWGDAGVPRYHNQFIAISGIVEFWSQDPGKLPTTTTKRGLDASSPIYLQVKNKMREGMKLFTNYTNKWKGQEKDSKHQISRGELLSLNEIKKKSQDLRMYSTPRSILTGEQHTPKLPMPKISESTLKKIVFHKEEKEVRKVAIYLRNPDMEPNDVGERCFDLIHRELINERSSLPFKKNKAADRFALVEAIRRLPILGIDLHNYTYFSLGGPYLEDMRQIYEFCPEIRMVSIEEKREICHRQHFHKPCQNIQIEESDLSSYITTFNPGCQIIFGSIIPD